MPRLSLYRPEKSQDYSFIDRQISEMFQVGGTDVYLHKYIGTNSTGKTEDFKDFTQIQDLMFLENRDRKYDEEIYRIRGIYNVQNIDFNLSQFGLFIDNDTVYMTVHINDFIKYINRKPVIGDVLELPHLRDNFAIDTISPVTGQVIEIGLPRYYVIEDVGRASEGFSATWYPHLYRLKLKKITDSQQFADVLNKAVLDANGDPIADGTTLRDLLSTHNKELLINDANIAEAERDAPLSGYQTEQFYTLAVDANGKAILNTADNIRDLDASITSITALESNKRPLRTSYTGYLVGDGIAANGYAEFGHGIQFPNNAIDGDYFLRTDFLPNRLFRFTGTRWVKVEDAVRMTMTNTPTDGEPAPNNQTRQTLKTSFINNSAAIYDQAVGVDFIKLPPVTEPVPANYNYVIPTNINYVTATYVVFKLDNLEIAYITADHSGIITNNGGKVLITLPVVDTVQERLPEDGVWRLSLCNNREEQRQSLSNVLRPRAKLKADL